MPLKTYTTEQKRIETPTEYLASGVKSPNSDREMQIILPIQKHPEVKGLVRAVDIHPEDVKKNWNGWVPYEEPKPAPKPIDPEPVTTPEALAIEKENEAKDNARNLFHEKLETYKRYQKSVHRGS